MKALTCEKFQTESVWTVNDKQQIYRRIDFDRIRRFERTPFAENRPYRLFTFTQWPRFRAKHLLKFPAQYD